MTNHEMEYLLKKVEDLSARVNQLERQLASRSERPTVSLQQPAAPIAPRPAVKVPIKPVAAPQPRESWEERIGGTWLNRLGVVALIVGLAFFLKYAFDSKWINEYGQIAIGVLLGFLLVAGAEYFRGRGALPRFGAALGGMGAASFYLTAYASSSQFYGLIGDLPALILLTVITAGAIGLALRHDSPVVAGFGLLGGYVTTLLMWGGGNHLTLLSYLLLLNLGTLAAMVWRRWLGLALISVIFTYLIFTVAYLGLYKETHLLSYMLFLSAFHLVFTGLGLVANLLHREAAKPPAVTVLVLSSIGYLFQGAVLMGDHQKLFAVVIAGWGLLFIAQHLLVGRTRDSRFSFALLMAGLAYLTLAVPIFFNSNWITIAWTVQAAALMLVGAQSGSLRLRGWGLGVLGLVLFRLVFMDLGLLQVYTSPLEYTLPWQDRLPTLLSAVLALFLSVWIYSGKKFTVRPWEGKLVAWLLGLANLVLLAGILREFSLYYNWQQHLGQIADGTVYRNGAWIYIITIHSLLLLVAGFRFRYSPIRQFGFILIIFALFRILIFNLQIFDSLQYLARVGYYGFAGVRLLPVLLVVGVSFALRRAYIHFGIKDWDGRNSSLLVFGGNLALLSLSLSEFNRYYYWRYSVDPSFAWRVFRDAAWSVTMGVHGLALVALGIWRQGRLLRQLGIGLLLLTVTKVILFDLTGLETVWRILVFSGTGAILIVASYLYQRHGIGKTI